MKPTKVKFYKKDGTPVHFKAKKAIPLQPSKEEKYYDGDDIDILMEEDLDAEMEKISQEEPSKEELSVEEIEEALRRCYYGWFKELAVIIKKIYEKK